ncbi:GNAT family N-acetyltransferase [Micromonospora sp. RTGN7]|uniref:GNAT family N-acetyltransferase n=1 Tax=Micromonospora sp. RTGN7 TaxID=3016526 RepID=UPI0029FED372|nr:GNAT family N-acetyltransferase [Micromonospora sp. RTGN7]
MIENLNLRHHTAAQAAGLVDQLVGLYLTVYADGDEFHSEDRYRRQLAGHMQRHGWDLVTATVDEELVGYIYGFPLPAETGWWTGMQEPVPAGFSTDEDGRRTFGISELMVASGWRRRGIARTLHDELLSGRAEKRATLLADPDNAPAQAAYRSWGWQKISKLRPNWEHAPTFDVLLLAIVVAD